MRKPIGLGAIALTLPLVACAGGYDRLTPPTVDLRNVDPVKYNNDVADCTDRKRNASFVGSAHIITDCMQSAAIPSLIPRAE